MVSLPPIKSVDKSSRGFACCVMVSGLAYLAMTALAAIVKIATQEAPPTETVMIDGTTGTDWGVMPSILVVAFNHGPFTYAAINHIFGMYWENGYKKVGGDGGARVTPWVSFPTPKRLIVNMSTLAPTFHDVRKAPSTDQIMTRKSPTLQVWTHRKPGGPGIYTICTIDPGAPADVLASDNLSAEHVKCDNEIYMSAQHNVIQTFYISKQFIPLKKRYWGFPGEKGTKEVFSLTAGSTEFTAPATTTNANLVMWFVVQNPIVEVIQPVSVIAQLNQAVGGLGGKLALVSALFAFLFVKKFERPALEKVGDVLTARWHKKEPFPDDPKSALLLDNE